MSLLFYAWGEPVYIVLMLFSSASDYFHGIWIEKARERGLLKRAKILLLSSLVINLGLLGFFKYSDFLLRTANQLFLTELPSLSLALPLGISFYTFQTMSYTIDVYRGKVRAQRDFIAFGAYVSLFPQLIAGPIVTYAEVEEQLKNRQESLTAFSAGIGRFIIGLGKKVLLANGTGMLWETVSSGNLQRLPVGMAWLGIAAYTMQIYFDFSGYSDMAIGLGALFGFRLPENFRYPYESRSITEFWRRWHMTLGSWFREYVYIPIGGNRGSLLVQIRNIGVVWLLTGIWHGADWNFILWGIYFGAILILEKFLIGKYLQKLPGLLQNLYALFCIVVGWVIFAFDRLESGSAYFRAMFGGADGGFFSVQTSYELLNYGLLLLIGAFAATHVPKSIFRGLKKRFPVGMEVIRTGYLTLIFLLSIAYLVDASYNPFLYFRF